MKYKLINNITKEEYLCDKIIIDEFNYYVINEEPTLSDTLNTCYYIFKNSLYKREFSHHKGCKKVIATNNPNIDIPKVVDEVERLAYEHCDKVIPKDVTRSLHYSFKCGYNKRTFKFLERKQEYITNLKLDI